jgi:chaperone modulatory protein CbpM
MKVERTDAQWLCDHEEISVEELAELSGLSPALLRELVEYGALVPVRVQSAHLSFAADCVFAVRAASRLRGDFDLDTNALSVALTLIERIRALEAQLRELQTQIPQLQGKR